MKRFFRTSSLVVLLALAAAVPASAQAPDGVPIQGSTVSADGMLPPQDAPGFPDCPAGTMWRYVSEGSGRLSHLGQVDVFVTHCSVFDEATGSGSFGSGTMTFTAANGDTLVLAQSGTFQLVGDPSSGEFLSEIEGEWTVVGGSGRFLDSSGSGHLVALGDLLAGDNGVTAARFDGMIHYDASMRSK